MAVAVAVEAIARASAISGASRTATVFNNFSSQSSALMMRSHHTLLLFRYIRRPPGPFDSLLLPRSYLDLGFAVKLSS